jgi:hypothetical protein
MGYRQCFLFLVLVLFLSPVVLAAGTRHDLHQVSGDSPIWTRLFILETVRERVEFMGSVEINYPVARGRKLELKSLELLSGGKVYVYLPLSATLAGDDGWYSDLVRDLEKLPPGLSYIYNQRKYFSADFHTRLNENEKSQLHEDLLDRIENAREDPYFALNPPTQLIKFDVPVGELVSEEDFSPGTEIPLQIRIRYGMGAREKVLELEHTITVVERLPSGPRGSFKMNDGSKIELGGTWHYGDLHVHDCKDETSIIGERGCPTCYAESLNWGDDNSLSEMKNQYDAMGADWFTITSHSYCVESASEYNQVKSQANSLSGSDFLVIPDSELNSEEEGPQEGDDTGNLICWNGVNHTGAHWITSWKAGGTDGLLEFCNEPIQGFSSNIRDIRSEGGFGIINHPVGDDWGWNSYQNTHGFNKQDGFQGVEIWNGPFRAGQGDSAGWWVRKILDGEPLYAYSGSDTHDDVFDCGWNHAYITGDYNSNNLKAALKMGRSYISNYQSLALVLRDRSTQRRALMGGGFPVTTGTTLEVAIYYDFGTKTGYIELYKGVVGDSGETLFHQESGLSGSGWLYVEDPSPASSGGFVYYRAYSSVSSGGNFSAYTNPVWARVLAGSAR